MSDKTNIMQLNKPLFDEMGWDEFLRQNADIIEGYVGKEHNADGTHKSINTPEVNTSIVRFADGSSANTGSAVAGAGTLQDVITAGSTANTSSDLIVRNAAGTQELLNVSATKGLQGMLGNIADPLVQIPFRRADDATRLSGVQTFTRAGTGTYIDPTDGLLKTAAIDEPRFERMADGGVGILLEGASTNRCLYSQDLTNAAWVKLNATVNITTVLSPDGSSFYDELMETSVTGQHRATPTASISAGTNTLSAYVKDRGDGRMVVLRFYNATDGTTAVEFDPSTGAVTRAFGTLTYSVVKIGDAWRISVTRTSTVTDVARVNISNGIVSLGNLSYLGDATKGIYVWGVQVEAIPLASSYIPTTGAALTRAADRLSIPISGNRLPATEDMTILLDFDHYDNSSGVSRNVINFGVGENHLLIRTTGSSWAPDKVYIYWGASNAIFINAIPTNTTHRIGVVHKAGVFSPVLDNVIYTGKPSTPTTGTATSIALGENFYGHVSNFRIYDKALTDQEIASA